MVNDLHSPALLDAAFGYGKEASGYADEKLREMRHLLTAQFPTVPPADVSRACKAAQAMLSACYDVGEACRNEAITFAAAKGQLAEQCPGFSEETYSSAVSYGMFISR